MIIWGTSYKENYQKMLRFCATMISRYESSKTITIRELLQNCELISELLGAIAKK